MKEMVLEGEDLGDLKPTSSSHSLSSPKTKTVAITYLFSCGDIRL